MVRLARWCRVDVCLITELTCAVERSCRCCACPEPHHRLSARRLQFRSTRYGRRKEDGCRLTQRWTQASNAAEAASELRLGRVVGVGRDGTVLVSAGAKTSQLARWGSSVDEARIRRAMRDGELAVLAE